jgi:hypothetical protein
MNEAPYFDKWSDALPTITHIGQRKTAFFMASVVHQCFMVGNDLRSNKKKGRGFDFVKKIYILCHDLAYCHPFRIKLIVPLSIVYPFLMILHRYTRCFL